MTNKKTERDAGLEVGEDQVVERTPGSDEEAVAPEPAESGDGSAEVEAASGASDELTQELEELRDRHLRLAAEFDNFRKRTTRELQQSGVRAQADLVERLLDPLDDLGRVAHLEAADAKAEDVIAGVGLVERKLLQQLEAAGLERIGREGEPFDPRYEEAVGTVPGDDPEQEGRVAAVLQCGYRFKELLVRPARVHVYVAPASDDEREEG